MSWFDATGLANIAKSALKGAQRTIDKALDIQEDEVQLRSTSAAEPIACAAPPVDPNLDDFFGSWGLSESQRDGIRNEVTITSSGSKSAGEKGETGADMWGSFGGSFFQTVTNKQDTGGGKERGSSDNLDEPFATGKSLVRRQHGYAEEENRTSSSESIGQDDTGRDNRLSVTSCESGKNSSESVEVVSGGGTGCTVSPDTEFQPSVTSPPCTPDSKARTSSSESVAITAPSSLEILSRETSEDTDRSFVSPSTLPVVEETTFREAPPITKGPGRVDMRLALSPPSSNVIDVPTKQEEDEGSQSDRTMTANDNAMESSSDTSTTTESNANLRTMLADAMTEKPVEQRRSSPPISSIGSDESLGQDSGDRAETATSSDIEIISSPTNGDSSSTQSRQHSPGKLPICLEKIAHDREPSEGSGRASDDDRSHPPEVDGSVKRIAELALLLEAREAQLMDANRRNAKLQEANSSLSGRLDSVLVRQVHSENQSLMAEEYTRRLSALEKKFQQAIGANDGLQKRLDECEREAATRVSRTELERALKEKEEIVDELRAEGDKLSRSQLQQSNIIKKLRAKEKEHESTIKKLREDLEDATSETERLKRSSIAREEVERTQIEAVHRLTLANRKSEEESTRLSSRLDDVVRKYETCKKSLDAAKKDALENKRAGSELQMRDRMLASLEIEKRMTESQNEEMTNEMEDLRAQLRSCSRSAFEKEETLRAENAALLRRLEDAERRNEQLAQSVMEVSKPLVRQLETLQATYASKVDAFEKIEQGLLTKIGDLQTKLESASDRERIAKEECVASTARISDLEERLRHANRLLENATIDTERERIEKSVSEQRSKREIAELSRQLEKATDTIDSLTQQSVTVVDGTPTTTPGNVSPTLSFVVPSTSRSESPTSSCAGRSAAETLANPPPPPPCFTNILELQMLQTNLKQRDGQVQQLRWELDRRRHEKSLLDSEISRLIARTEELSRRAADSERSEQQLRELQRQYETLMQLYGEKVEETDELRLDLQDVKDLYKAQVDEFLRSKNPS